MPSNSLPGEDVRNCLLKILNSPEFRNSPRLSRFLTYVVEESLAGRQEQIKESAIGVAVFDRKPGYDPKTDSIVRTQAVELRQKLARYYNGNGAVHSCRILLPKGSYVPQFQDGEILPPARSETSAEPGFQRTRASRYLVIAGAVCLLGLGAWLLWNQFQSKPQRTPKLTRITSDVGSAITPALSPSGELIAYASDRGGHADFDIYVQPVNGTEALRLTNDPSADTMPEFSPDASLIAFRREGAGAGIYVVHALGGGERLLAANGSSPRFSPDGRRIAFDRPAPYAPRRFQFSGKAFLIQTDGAQERPICPDFAVVTNPVWNPDGKHLLFLGAVRASSGNLVPLDWWVTPVDTCNPVRTGAAEALRRKLGQTGTVPDWPEDGIAPRYWKAQGVVFASSSQAWSIPLSPMDFRVAGSARQLTFGTGAIGYPSPANDKLAFEQVQPVSSIFALPIDADTAKVTGNPHLLVEDLDETGLPTISTDGRYMTYYRRGRKGAEIHVKELPSGADLAIPFESDIGWPEIVPDGRQIFFFEMPNRQQKGFPDVYRVDRDGRNLTKICAGCQFQGVAANDNSQVFVRRYEKESGRQNVFEFLDLNSGKATIVLKWTDRNYALLSLSPDEKWVAFIEAAFTPRWERCRVRIAPYRHGQISPEAEWVDVTSEGIFRVPLWSPDGNTLYFQTEQDGRRSICAQHLHPKTKRRAGDPITIVSNLGRKILPDLGRTQRGFGVAKDKIVFPLIETRSNIWMLE
jgi:Tol biopolymer transport system component